MNRSRLLCGATALTLAAAAACSDKAKARATADSDLARDLALAGAQPVQAAQPTFQDTSVAPAPTRAGRTQQAPPAPVRTHTSNKPVVQTPRPVATAPAPIPAPQPAPVTVAAAPAPTPAAAPAEIGSGTGIGVTSGSKVCSNSNLPGDKIVATVNSAVTGVNGALIPAGSTVVLEVASASSGANGDAAQLTFRVRAVEINGNDYPVAADVTSDAALQKQKVQGTDPNADKKKVIGGAIAGAILGQMIGHSTKGTVIGAATGAAAGAVVARSGGEKWEACLPAGSQLKITLNQPIVIS